MRFIPHIYKKDEMIAAYADSHADFKTELDKHLFQNNIKLLSRDWDDEISEKDLLILYSIEGSVVYNGELLKEIPTFDKSNDVHWYYLGVAISKERFDIFDKLFCKWKLLDMLNLFADYYSHSCKRNYCSDSKKVFFPSDEQYKTFFLKWIKILLGTDNNNINVVQTFFPMLLKSEHSYEASHFIDSMCSKYPELIQMIAQSAAEFKPEYFLDDSIYKQFDGRIYSTESSIFKLYCQTLSACDCNDILAIGKYLFHLVKTDYSLFYHNSDIVYALDRLLEPYFDDNMLTALLKVPVIDEYMDTSFVFAWYAHFISLRLLSKKGKFPKKDLISRSIDKVLNCDYQPLGQDISILLSNLVLFQKEQLYYTNDSDAPYLLYLLYADTLDADNSILFAERAYKELPDKEICYWLYQTAFLKKYDMLSDDIYLENLPFDLLLFPVSENPLLYIKIAKKTLDEVGNNYKSRCKTVDSITNLARKVCDLPEYFGRQDNKPELSFLAEVNQIEFIDGFFQKAQSEEINNTHNLIELYTLLEIKYHFPNEFNYYLLTMKNNAKWLEIRCSKALNALAKKQPSEWENDVDAIHLIAAFVSQKSLWKGLQPFLTAFRNSKEQQVAQDLEPNHTLSYLIRNCFRSNNENDLEKLRIDMAASFCNYLNPKNDKPRQEEKYTDFEKVEQGFNLNFAEPSPFWRYAYARALADLAVKSDGNGHFFKKPLEDALGRESNEQVKAQLKKTLDSLQRIRETYSSSRNSQRLYEAFWQLREAHMYTLGVKIDREAAKRLRVQEGHKSPQ
jgi:hypothetical protein